MRQAYRPHRVAQAPLDVYGQPMAHSLQPMVPSLR